MCKLVQFTHLREWTVRIWHHVKIWKCDRGINEWVYISDYVSLNDRNRFYSSKDKSITIWKFCSIANNVSFIASVPHDYSCLTTYFEFENFTPRYTWAPIVVWNDVRIWKDAIILKGVTIWTWAVIWAWSVVTKDVPPYAIVVWNPAKVIKYRFDEKTVKDLLKSKWRDWDVEKIILNYDFNK
jgi:virginiamycin A acetyltransferase